jgi:hypothetical protein
MLRICFDPFEVFTIAFPGGELLEHGSQIEAKEVDDVLVERSVVIAEILAELSMVIGLGGKISMVPIRAGGNRPTVVIPILGSTERDLASASSVFSLGVGDPLQLRGPSPSAWLRMTNICYYQAGRRQGST